MGIVAAGIVGLLLQQMYFQRRKMQAPGRPMRTFPPEDTPAKVVRAAREAACIYYVLVAVLILVLLFFLYLVLRGFG